MGVFPEFGEAPDSKAEQRVVKRVRYAMFRTLKAAGLPLHFTPHCLRHSYGTGLISRGVSPAFVQQQTGHASIQQTVDTYGSWLPVRVPGAVDAMLAATVPGPLTSRMVATGHFEPTTADSESGPSNPEADAVART